MRSEPVVRDVERITTAPAAFAFAPKVVIVLFVTRTFVTVFDVEMNVALPSVNEMPLPNLASGAASLVSMVRIAVEPVEPMTRAVVLLSSNVQALAPVVEVMVVPVSVRPTKVALPAPVTAQFEAEPRTSLFDVVEFEKARIAPEAPATFDIVTTFVAVFRFPAIVHVISGLTWNVLSAVNIVSHVGVPPPPPEPMMVVEDPSS